MPVRVLPQVGRRPRRHPERGRGHDQDASGRQVGTDSRHSPRGIAQRTIMVSGTVQLGSPALCPRPSLVAESLQAFPRALVHRPDGRERTGCSRWRSFHARYKALPLFWELHTLRSLARRLAVAAAFTPGLEQQEGHTLRWRFSTRLLSPARGRVWREPQPHPPVPQPRPWPSQRWCRRRWWCAWA